MKKKGGGHPNNARARGERSVENKKHRGGRVLTDYAADAKK